MVFVTGWVASPASLFPKHHNWRIAMSADSGSRHTGRKIWFGIAIALCGLVILLSVVITVFAPVIIRAIRGELF